METDHVIKVQSHEQKTLHPLHHFLQKVADIHSSHDAKITQVVLDCPLFDAILN